MDHDDHIKIDPELLQNLQHHVKVFASLGKQMEEYLIKVNEVKEAMEGIHTTILALTEDDWPRINEFCVRLEDQIALWSVMADDIQKLGPEFVKHGKQFRIVQEILKKRKEKADEFRRFTADFEKMKKSPRVPTKQKFEAKKIVEEKEMEYNKVNEESEAVLQESRNSKQKFIVSTYGKFLGAHAEFCEQSLQVHEAIPDILRGFLSQ